MISNKNLSNATISALDKLNDTAQQLGIDVYCDRKQTEQWGAKPIANPYKTYLSRIKFDTNDKTANEIGKALFNQAKTQQGGNSRDDVEQIVYKYIETLNDFYRDQREQRDAKQA